MATTGCKVAYSCLSQKKTSSQKGAAISHGNGAALDFP